MGIAIAEIKGDFSGKTERNCTVPERRMKYAIEDVADSCWGVKDVENHVRVQSSRLGEEATSGQRSAASGSSGSTKGSEQTRAEARKSKPINSALMPGIEIDIRQVVVFIKEK